MRQEELISFQQPVSVSASRIVMAVIPVLANKSELGCRLSSPVPYISGDVCMIVGFSEAERNDPVPGASNRRQEDPIHDPMTPDDLALNTNLYCINILVSN